ncbi:TPA: hypothetical protein ACLBJV_002023, partial [Neisseria meningitidis]
RFHVLDSRFRGNDEILDYGNLSGMIESIEKPQESIRKNRNPTAVIPAKAGIQTRRHGNLPNKTVSLDSTSQIPAFAGMTRF